MDISTKFSSHHLAGMSTWLGSLDQGYDGKIWKICDWDREQWVSMYQGYFSDQVLKPKVRVGSNCEQFIAGGLTDCESLKCASKRGFSLVTLLARNLEYGVDMDS